MMSLTLVLQMVVAASLVAADLLPSLPLTIAPAPSGTPMPAPSYMQDNQGNPHGAAPDKGFLDGPVFGPLTRLIQNALHGNGTIVPPPAAVLDNLTTVPAGLEETHVQRRDSFLEKRSDFWIADITHGQMPFAGAYYSFYRNVKDFGAVGNGLHDDTAAINLAIAAGNRCGAKCGSTSTKGAMVYFPPGTYVISTPIVQYYYTQFVGDYNQRPTIKGASNFSGIALIDTDFYIPGGSGAEWYINQNQFYRQIRNFVLDLTSMPRATDSGGQPFVPTGIHYQVAQATSLQNIDFVMSHGSNAVGIFMENGSGGFASDLSFTGGNIGWRAGSQQFTARNIQFNGCITAVSMIWDWGFTWQNIQATSCLVAFDGQSFGGEQLASGQYQGTGSLAILDSTFNSVGTGIQLNSNGSAPNLVLDNLFVQKTNSIVAVAGGTTILAGTTSSLTVQSWAMGLRYVSEFDTGHIVSGNLSPAPVKSTSLLANGKWFTQSKPQYAGFSASSFVSATANGVSNAATGDQAAAINKLLANNIGKPIFFPAGIYVVRSTVFVPVGSIIVGEGWSQIMASGPFFSNTASPQVMVRVGNPGDKGVIQISDLLFTVQGATAGAILLEWNVHESTQGSAAMWDSHFRVGGAYGTNLSMANCPQIPKGSAIASCMAASMLMHVTPSASGYFENIWAWVADHDLDSPLNAGNGDDNNGKPIAANVQISIFAARGILVESQGPTWFYGTASEHSVKYQYQLLNARNVFLGHMQTETPYYQPYFAAPSPFGYALGSFPADPTFKNCQSGTTCNDAWALRVLNSSNVFVYSAGLYSFFTSYYQTCTDKENCQQSLLETSFSQGFWLYNLFTKGATQVISPDGNVPIVYQNATHQLGFTSEISAWLALALGGSDQGSIGGSTPIYTTVTTIITNGKTFTLTLSDATASSAGSPAQKTTITTNGQTLTVTLPNRPTPPPTKVTTVTTNGQTFTVTLTDATASSTGSPPQKTTITTNGQTLTFTVPNQPSPAPTQVTTVTTNGQTFTLTLTGPTTSSPGSPPQKTTVTTNGQTLTFTLPNGASSGPVGMLTTITTTDGSGRSTTLIDTLYPTTTTDASGHTFIGTITRGPSPSPPVYTGLTTYSTFPPGASWSSTSVASNTHDSDGHPVIGPWPGCWFCPPGSHGIVIFDFPPGIYPPGGPPKGLPTPFPPLTIEPDGTPEYPPSSAKESTAPCTSHKTATDVTYYVSYGVNSAGSTTATSTYSTTTARITGCSVVPYTGTITTAGSSAGGYCQPSDCGMICTSGAAAPRAIATSPPVARSTPLPDRFMLRAAGIEVGDLDARAPSPESEHSWDLWNSTAQLMKRNLPAPGTGNWQNFYGPLFTPGSANALIVDNDQKIFGTFSSAYIQNFNTQPASIVVGGMYGCLSVIAVSHSGAFVTHFWQNPSLNLDSQFEPDVIDILNNFFTTYGPSFFNSATKLFIFAGASKSIRGDTSVEQATLAVSDSSGPDAKYAARYTAIMNTLANYFPNVKPLVFAYDRQVSQTIQNGGVDGSGLGAYGKAATTDPSSGATLPSNTAAIQVYLQSFKAYQATFPNIQVQIWRMNFLVVDGNPPNEAANVAQMVNVGQNFDFCGDTTQGQELQSTTVTIGSENTNVDTTDTQNGFAFNIPDYNGNSVQTNCKFVGTTYAPDSGSGGRNAGTLTCDGGYSVQCVRPSDNLATTCGGTSVSQCGKLGVNCPTTYYQLLASCRV